MEICDGLKINLISIGIDINALSEKEKRFLSQIYEVFSEYKKATEENLTALSKNKFNRTTVAAKVECSRQTLYANPTISAYLDWCEKQADAIYNKANPNNVISKDKYNRLKEENQKLLVNIVDDAVKDSEIERLARENQELRQRILVLTERLNEKEHKSSATIIQFKHNN